MALTKFASAVSDLAADAVVDPIALGDFELDTLTDHIKGNAPASAQLAGIIKASPGSCHATIGGAQVELSVALYLPDFAVYCCHALELHLLNVDDAEGRRLFYFPWLIAAGRETGELTRNLTFETQQLACEQNKNLLMSMFSQFLDLNCAVLRCFEFRLDDD